MIRIYIYGQFGQCALTLDVQGTGDALGRRGKLEHLVHHCEWWWHQPAQPPELHLNNIIHCTTRTSKTHSAAWKVLLHKPFSKEQELHQGLQNVHLFPLAPSKCVVLLATHSNTLVYFTPIQQATNRSPAFLNTCLQMEILERVPVSDSGIFQWELQGTM